MTNDKKTKEDCVESWSKLKYIKGEQNTHTHTGEMTRPGDSEKAKSS